MRWGPTCSCSCRAWKPFDPTTTSTASGCAKACAATSPSCCLIALPSTARTAPQVSEDEIRGGFIDPPLLDGLCRYAFLANLTGLPAVSVPIGDDRDGLPVGLQLIGDAWDEACVLQPRRAAHRPRRPEPRRRHAAPAGPRCEY